MAPNSDKILKFSGLPDGEVTFSDWIYLYENRCVTKGTAIADFIFERAAALPNAQVATIQKYAECKSDLVTHLKEDALQFVKNLGPADQNARAMRIALSGEYRNQAPSSRHIAIKELVTTAHDKDTSIERYCNSKRQLAYESLNGQIEIGELLTTSITSGLGPEYDVVANRVLSLPVGAPALPYADLLRQLKEQETLNESRREEVDTASSTAIAQPAEAQVTLDDIKVLLANAWQGGKGGKGGKGAKSAGKGSHQFQGKCWKCGMKGHKGSDCRRSPALKTAVAKKAAAKKVAGKKQR